MSDVTTWVIQIRGREMEKNFEKIVKEGINLEEDLKEDLREKFPELKEFITDENGKETLRFWRFVKGRKNWKSPKKGDYILFVVPSENTVYIAKTSNTKEDPYDKTLNNYKLLKSPHPTIYNPRYKTHTKFPNAFLIKLVDKKHIKIRDFIEQLKQECECKEFSSALIYCNCPEQDMDSYFQESNKKNKNAKQEKQND